MREIIKKIIGLWNIYGGIILSGFLAWVFGFKSEKMDATTSFMIMSLACISLLTFFKKTLFGKKTNVIENALLNNQSLKAMKTAIDPIQGGEEIGKTIIETEKILGRIGKKIMKWILKNKGAIVGALGIILGTLEMIFNWLGQFLPSEIGFNIVSLIYYIVGGVTAVFTSGFGSTQFKEKLSMIKDQLNGDKTDLQYINDKNYLKRQKSTYKKAIEQVEKEKTSLSTNYLEVINDYESCQRLGLRADEDTFSKYQEYQNELSKLESKLAMKRDAYNKYEEKLKELEALNTNSKKENNI